MLIRLIAERIVAEWRAEQEDGGLEPLAIKTDNAPHDNDSPPTRRDLQPVQL
jgi:hypothetical protein